MLQNVIVPVFQQFRITFYFQIHKISLGHKNYIPSSNSICKSFKIVSTKNKKENTVKLHSMETNTSTISRAQRNIKNSKMKSKLKMSFVCTKKTSSSRTNQFMISKWIIFLQCRSRRHLVDDNDDIEHRTNCCSLGQGPTINTLIETFNGCLMFIESNLKVFNYPSLISFKSKHLQASALVIFDVLLSLFVQSESTLFVLVCLAWSRGCKISSNKRYKKK